MEQPSYFSIIPATVRYDYKLTMTERMLFGEITALSNKYGYCTASNNYFARLYKNPKGKPASKQSVSRWIRHLKERGYILIKYDWNSSRTIKSRKIYPQFGINGGVNKNVNTPKHSSYSPINKNVKENNTSVNNTSINNIKSSSIPHKKNKPVDPFAVPVINTKEEEDKFINYLIDTFSSMQKVDLTGSQHSQLSYIIRKMAPIDARDVVFQVIDTLAQKKIRDPVAYLIKALWNSGTYR